MDTIGKISSKDCCCGCSACVQKCPRRCIQMQEDTEGFLYPIIDESKCVKCGLCSSVCPVIKKERISSNTVFYASQNPNESIRLSSSSGGIFSMLAENIIKKGGVVFGARFNDRMEVVHDYAETIEGIAPFRGSKYLQSNINETYKKAEALLEQGRTVLFSGTPCQISGLKFFLGKEYERLFCADVICHGVPSPRVFGDYLKYLGKGKDVVSFNFRDKCTGWVGFSTSYAIRNGKRKSFRVLLDYYFRGGLVQHYFLRPVCHKCPAKGGKSGSDITLGDLWHIQFVPELKNDDKGASLIAVNTEKGERIIRELELPNLVYQKTELVHKYNTAFYKSCLAPNDREEFWNDYSRMGFKAVLKFDKRILPTRWENRWIVVKINVKKILNNCLFHKK